MLVTRRVWILFLALPNHVTLRPGHLFCKMGISDLPLSAVLRNRWDYIFHSSSPAHMVLVIFLRRYDLFEPLECPTAGSGRDYAQRRSENQSLLTEASFHPFLFPQTHPMSDFMFYMPCRFSVLWTQPGDQTSRTRVLGLGPRTSAGCCSCTAVQDTGSAPGGEPGHRPRGNNLFPFDFLYEEISWLKSTKTPVKIPCFWQARKRMCVSGEQQRWWGAESWCPLSPHSVPGTALRASRVPSSWQPLWLSTGRWEARIRTKADRPLSPCS